MQNLRDLDLLWADLFAAAASHAVGRTLVRRHTAHRHRRKESAARQLVFIVKCQQIRDWQALGTVACALVTGGAGDTPSLGFLILQVYQCT